MRHWMTTAGRVAIVANAAFVAGTFIHLDRAGHMPWWASAPVGVLALYALWLLWKDLRTLG